MKIRVEWNEISVYDVECLCRLFFDNDTIKNDTKDDFVLLIKESDKIIVRLKVNGILREKEEICPKAKEKRQTVAFAILYKFLVEATSIVPPWGILTGIRPVKIFRKFESDLGREKTKKLFLKDFLVLENKVELACKTVDCSKEAFKNPSPFDVSLYISIPFCPSRCLYCSFVSSSVEKTAHLIKPYVELLCSELCATAEIIKKFHLKLKTVYIGGGTPTSLSASELSKILSTINKNFQMKDVIEFTVEAGRPDTITEDKLLELKLAGVNRISINPQTFNDRVLKNIGRKHDSQKTLESFYLSRRVGFKNVNMDLIAGLPSDTLESFKDTLNSVIKLSPENITVHTLSIKRASNLNAMSGFNIRSSSEDVSQMLDLAKAQLECNDFYPYYLYRQSNMIGNLENVGWAKKDALCYYNVYMMDEVHTVMACGAGAVTKLKNPYSDNINRVFNFKYPYEYINRFHEILERKEEIKSFYNKLK